MEFKIQVIGTQKGFNPSSLLNHYSLIFEQFNHFIIMEDNKNFIDFLKAITTVGSNYNDILICNFIKEVVFEMKNFNGFYIKDSYEAVLICKEEQFNDECYGSFVIENTFVIHFVSNYIFIEEIKTKKQYMYYCD